MQTRTGLGQSATLLSVDSTPTKTLSMRKPFGWTSRSNVSTLATRNLGATVLIISCSYLLQYVQPLHRSWDAGPGSNDDYTNTITISSATTGSMEHGPPTTRSVCPASFPWSRGSVRRCVVCSSRSKHDPTTNISEQTPFRQSIRVTVS